MTNKILRIPRNQLPPVQSDNKYSVRFRLISEDKNRVSHWSPIFVIDSTTPVSVQGGVVVNGSIITAVWGDEEGRPEYDVFVKFDGGSYAYHGTSPIHSYSFLKGAATSNVRVTVQITGAVKEINNTLKIFESNITSL
jgi:hypothetical protein